VAAWDLGLRVLDVSNPVTPVEVGVYPTLDLAADVSVAGDYAYVVEAGGRLNVVDISNPSAPIGLGT